MAQHIDKEILFAGIVTVEGLLRGNARLRQNGIDTGCQIALLKKQPLGCGAEPLACLLGACVLSVFHGRSSLLRNVLSVTIVTWRTLVVKSQLDLGCMNWWLAINQPSRQCRGRFTEPSADLSAICGINHTRIIL